MWAGVDQDESTGEPTEPCQSKINRLGINAIPNGMAAFYTLANSSRTYHRGSARPYGTPVEQWVPPAPLCDAGITMGTSKGFDH